MSVFRALLLTAGLFLLASQSVPNSIGAPDSRPAYVPGRVLVKPKAGRDLGSLHAATGSRLLAQTAGPNLQVVAVQPGREADAIAAYQDSGEVEFAEPDYILRAAKVPNDPRYAAGDLWALHNTGQEGGLAGADLGAELAWDVLDAATNVTVAVVDSGIRYTHEDLADNMWVNPGEIPDNGIDDDGDGLVDDVHGINAYDGTGDPMDDNGHGTHVAGIIGAVGDNNKGSVGVAWQVKLMACKFMDSNGEGATSDAVVCIDYARKHGAKIINASWGGGFFSYSLQNAIKRARDAGMIVVVAAGNDGADLDYDPSYPASYTVSNVVTVAATTRNDELADYSNVGLKTVLLAAPGSDIYSTWYTSDKAYAVESGTSMATPFVAGVFALAKARFPDDSYLQLIQRISEATDRLSSLGGYCITGGRIDLRKALGAASKTAPRPATLSVSLNASMTAAQFTLSGEPGAKYQIETSMDLVTWAPLVTVQAASDGSLAFSDPAGLNYGQRFFRARLVNVQ